MRIDSQQGLADCRLLSLVVACLHISPTARTAPHNDPLGRSTTLEAVAALRLKFSPWEVWAVRPQSPVASRRDPVSSNRGQAIPKLHESCPSSRVSTGHCLKGGQQRRS
ncbi:uncharacterized protein B0I36DRAFT_85768 [Microdochium trichocladiopsis]|uniref:Secreted protein n=1 Tax=Microdochium trichocladiopsis TaxID=1682393 RepID=A0A9P8YDG2_9PEZI|nr:uncharacterized protein B0I36DRAFT_85768 [Microdochium trichocladiopsis]KAH7034931.1 hypothetical protein B0I36DRAFT_85768 [Microdochium trichocladiopsis]